MIKINNIEEYSLTCIRELQKCYSDYLEKSEGIDPDYPEFSFAGSKQVGKTIKGFNAAALKDELGEEEFNRRIGKGKDNGDYIGLSKKDDPDIPDGNSWLGF